MTTIDPFKYIDAAAQYTDESLEPVANQQWNDLDYMIRCIMDRMPERCHDDFLEDVTNPNF